MEPNQPRTDPAKPQPARSAPAPHHYSRRIDCSPAGSADAGRSPPPHGGGRPDTTGMAD